MGKRNRVPSSASVLIFKNGIENLRHARWTIARLTHARNNEISKVFIGHARHQISRELF